MTSKPISMANSHPVSAPLYRLPKKMISVFLTRLPTDSRRIKISISTSVSGGSSFLIGCFTYFQSMYKAEFDAYRMRCQRHCLPLRDGCDSKSGSGVVLNGKTRSVSSFESRLQRRYQQKFCWMLTPTSAGTKISSSPRQSFSPIPATNTKSTRLSAPTCLIPRTLIRT